MNNKWICMRWFILLGAERIVRIKSNNNYSNNSNNNRELTEGFRKLKALYNIKKNIPCANTHNCTNEWYTSIQNTRKLTILFIQSLAKTHAHRIKRTHAPARQSAHTHTHTHNRACARAFICALKQLSQHAIKEYC